MNSPRQDGQFPTTQWTLIARLHSTDEAIARRALDDLCAQYHFPLYCFIRRRGLTHHDAEDALHDFLAKLLRLEIFATADADKGRLRSFLCTSLQRFLANWYRDRSRQPLNLTLASTSAEAERRYRIEGFHDHETPERQFDRQWARELLTRVLQHLGDKYEERGKSAIFAALNPVLQRGGSLRQEDTASLASTLGLTPGNLRITHHRLLRDYRELLEAEVLQTVATRGEVKDEIAHLLSCFRKE